MDDDSCCDGYDRKRVTLTMNEYARNDSELALADGCTLADVRFQLLLYAYIQYRLDVTTIWPYSYCI